MRTAELARRLGEGLAALAIRDETQPAIDLEALAEQPTVEGRFAQRMLDVRRRPSPRAATSTSTRRAPGCARSPDRREPVDVG